MDELTLRGARARFAVPLFAAMFLLGGLFGCQTSAPGPAVPSAGSKALGLDGGPSVGDADEFLVVDCLLPGQLRSLGRHRPLMSARRQPHHRLRLRDPRRRVRRLRPRQLPDRLKVAGGGRRRRGAKQRRRDLRAGLGTAPDYGHGGPVVQEGPPTKASRAKINLGFLYEQGLGVPRDQAGMALNLYRRGVGLR